MKKIILGCIILATSLISCEPAATFDQPQPADTKILTAFPEMIWGTYLSEDEASTLTITKNMMSRTYEFDSKFNRDSLPNTYKLIGDTLIDTVSGLKEKVLVKADTIIQHVHFIDTLFKLSSDNVLKEFRGYLFLNIRYSDKQWTVQKLSLKNGLLTVGSISQKEDINRLKAITQTTSDTASKYFKLTRKQFNNFIKQHGFSEEETFTKINKETVIQVTEDSFL